MTTATVTSLFQEVLDAEIQRQEQQEPTARCAGCQRWGPRYEMHRVCRGTHLCGQCYDSTMSGGSV